MKLTTLETLESRQMLSVVPHLPRIHKLTATPPAVTAGTGITGEYFAGNQTQIPVVIRQDQKIDFNWTSGRPDQDIAAGVFSALWVGQIEPTTTANYTFYTNSDSGTLVTVNADSVINNLSARTASLSSGSIQLTAGQKYSLLVQYVSRGKGASKMQLYWSSPTMARQLVPTAALFPTTETLPSNTPLVGSYYEGINFNKLLMTRADSSINFNWGTGVPDSVIPQNTPFSVRWTGEYTAPVTGKYTFESITDDGVRLWVDGIEIIKDWHVHSAQSDLGKISLVAGQTYSIRMDYFQDGAGHTSAKLLTQLPGQGKVERFVHFIVPGPATPANLAVATASATQLNVSWSDVADETGFVLERATAGSNVYSPVATLPQGTLSYVDTGVSPATSYQYEIIATDAQGDSNPSMPATGTTDPGAVTATATAAGTTATISYTTAGTPTSYLIERSLNPGGGFTSVGTTSATSFNDSTLSNATTYYYRVTASNSAGSSAPSNVVSVTTVTAAPVNLSATVASQSQINLAWNDVTGETGFIVQRSADGSTGWTQIASVPTGTVSLPVGGLTASTQYFFRVIAIDAGGNSAPSNVANATTNAPNPSYATLTTIFGLTGSGQAYSINTSNGAATQIGTLSFGTNAAGRDTYTGNFYYVSTGTSTVNLSSWNPNDGVNTVINPSIALSGPVAEAAFRSDGDMFLTTDLGDLYEINSDTGVATHNGTIHANGSTLMTGNGDLAFDPNNNLFIETSSQLYEVSAAAVNAATDTTSIVTATDIGPTGTQNLQIAFGQNGILYGTDASGQLYSVNTATAATTPIGTPTGINMGDLASVPLYANLSVAQTASTFTRGSNGTYTLTVNNAGPNQTVGPITLIDTLPAGISFVSGSGNGWAFSVSGQTVTMTYTPDVLSGASAVPAVLTVAVGSSAASSVTNTVNVSTNIFDTNTANETGTLVSSVLG
jgi:uncharacterized repeat protein (TIGR01451 family)